ncbi:DMT family transporter [Paenibacillus profundus]|uniref:DMT family transporter n=1 Tax=Paenibacillus profundus TaxID=1173085 RepID=A0ABS8YSG2_9BACL|nr:DMT family transporter [Paenibacillus profundus]MCE5173242.1 DMT family transporter [Paenibacillus profundus]
MKFHSSAAGHLAALLTILIWGTTFISTKVLLVDFSPFEILFFRFTIGYAALLAVYPRFVKSKNIREELLFAAAGFCGVTMYFLLENIALTYTLASNVGIIASVAPFFTAVMAHFFLKGESLQPLFFVGFAVAMLGIVLIAFNGSYILRLNPKGDILAVLACIFWATYSILMRKISGLGYHNIGCTRRVFFYGLLFMLPPLLLSDSQLGLERFAEPVNLLNILFLGLGASALCFVTWNWCVGILGAIKTSAYIYLVPVITIAASYLFLHETITGAALLGTLLTLAGLFLSEKKHKKKTKFKEVDYNAPIG